MVFDKLFGLVIGFLVGGFVARTIGPTDYGSLASIFSIVGISTVLGSLGLDQILSKHFTLNENSTTKILGTSLALQLCSGGIVYALILLLLAQLDFFHGNRSSYVATAIAGLILFLQPIGFTLSCYFDSQLLSRIRVWALKISALVSAAFKIFAVLNGGKVISLCLIWVGEMVLATFLLYFFFSKKGFPAIATWRPSLATAKSLLHDSAPLLLSSAAAYIFLYVDTLMIKQICGASDAGYYAAAVRIAELVYFVPAAVLTTLLPFLVKIHAQGGEKYLKLRKEIYRAIAAASWMIFFSLYVAGPPMISLIFGEEFLASRKLFSLHIFSTFAVFLGACRQYFFLVEGKTRFTLINNVIGLVINVGLNWILLPIYGPIAAAGVTVFSYTVSYMATSFFWRPTFGHGTEQISAIFWPFPNLRILRSSLESHTSHAR